MEKKSAKIYIIGAGISGLIAAKTLEEKGYAPTLLEATNSVGGRVKTDVIEGTFFDHGFQVLLSAYPQAKKHLNYADLKLHQFKPGALIFKNGKAQRIGDPLRDISALLPTVFSSIGSISDKIKIFTLTQRLKKKSIQDIFTSVETTTLKYLKGYGFSSRIISDFFKPFFTGIFLEEALQTSSRMFEFVFKMFGEGYATLPENGIGAIPEQLFNQLHHSQFRYGQKVKAIDSQGIHMESGEILESDATLATIPIDAKTGAVNFSAVDWKSCDNLYFAVEKRTFEEGIIGLIADNDALTNNLYYPFGQTVSGDVVLSVTVVKSHTLNEADLVDTISSELLEHCGITIKSFLKKYTIRQALPDVKDLKMELSPDNVQVFKKVFLAGDYVLNGSLNAAMASGEATAKQLMSVIK
ncbi:FAD-dependent oxidoreductase [Flagellimonas sp. HMM57]|uniref:NAD(P)/FAD-dependent oxidoreductase n=1 Tax=unclassified Flagellimonas TaxID=2644544 RepID=UPI0013D8936F|nr:MULTISPECIES: NAD(P)/FAD-dependent oxidoreductase [unclassified Flagellimonas]UII77464.1 FAD-dependent oxidoreductase [Flagellimonas sp. HMM57]